MYFLAQVWFKNRRAKYRKKQRAQKVKDTDKGDGQTDTGDKVVVSAATGSIPEMEDTPGAAASTTMSGSSHMSDDEVPPDDSDDEDSHIEVDDEPEIDYTAEIPHDILRARALFGISPVNPELDQEKTSDEHAGVQVSRHADHASTETRQRSALPNYMPNQTSGMCAWWNDRTTMYIYYIKWNH